ncbi:MAG TPA: zf-HC2 domain-containing protein [Holophagaceae bacterium]|nr:zf-HC2 domain-containing protein [Holophagaceae bacterium]
MTSPHVLDQLPLWVEGDLPRPELEAVEQHLAGCLDCREAAHQLRQSQAWLRESLASPFEAADHARLQAAVMARLATAAPAPRRFLAPSAFLAAAAALLVAVLTWHPRAAGPRLAPPPEPHPPQAAPNLGPIPSDASPGTAPSPGPGPRPQARSRPAPPPDPISQPDPTPQGGPARLEFQTADPTIRIIWLAQATPRPDTKPSLPEAP